MTTLASTHTRSVSPHDLGQRPDAVPAPDATELFEELGDAAGGVGLAVVSYLGAIPGFLPMVALTVAALAILAIPMLVVGALIGVPLLIARIAARAISAVIATRPDAGRSRGERLRPLASLSSRWR